MFKKKWFKRLCVVIGCVVALYLLLFVVNVFINISLRNYIKSFEPVDYSSIDRIVPVSEDGLVTLKTDRELKIAHITDIHIGGGFWTYKNDKKTIYELITMLQEEKPDIVISTGDNTYCVIPFGFNGGGTFNNMMVAKTFITIFDHEGVYFDTVFGNHDTESMDYASRQKVGNLYQNGFSEYSMFKQGFTDLNSDTVPSVTNQFIQVKNTEGKIVKLLLLIDSNAYEDTKFFTAVFGKYDVIHEAQVEWAADMIKELSEKEGLPEGQYLETLAFMHIPVGEYRTALDELITETRDEKGNITGFTQNPNPQNTEFVEGEWGEEKVCYGGLYRKDEKPEDLDNFFEVLCEDMGSVEAIFCGHDHTNSAVVKYKGVLLDYGYSLDNEAYGDKIMKAGRQRGLTLITISPDGTFKQVHKNAYTDYGVSKDKFEEIDMNYQLYPNMYRTVK